MKKLSNTPDKELQMIPSSYKSSLNVSFAKYKE